MKMFKLLGVRHIIRALMESGLYLTLRLSERRDLVKRVFLTKFDVK